MGSMRAHSVLLLLMISGSGCSSSSAPADLSGARVDQYGDPLPGGATARLGTARLAHSGDIHSIACSSDGKLLASSADDGTVRIWNVADGRLAFRINSDAHLIPSVSFSPSGELLAFGSDDGTIEVWDVPHRQQTVKFRAHDGVVTHVAFAQEGGSLYSSSMDSSIRRWDPVTGALRKSFQTERPVVAMDISPKGNLMAFVEDLPRVVVRDIATDEFLLVSHPKNAVQAVRFSLDNRMLGVCEADEVRLFELSKSQFPIRSFNHSRLLNAIAFHPGGEFLIGVGSGNHIRCWNLKTGELDREYLADSDANFCVAISPDGNTLCSGGHGHRVQLWDFTGKSASRIPPPFPWMAAIAVNQTASLLAGGEANGEIRLLKARGEVVQKMAGHRGAVGVLSPLRENHLASGGYGDATVRLWDWRSGKMLWNLEMKQKDWMEVNVLSISRDGSHLAVGGRVEEASPLGQSTACIVALDSGAILHMLGGHPGWGTESLCFSQSGDMLATGGDDGRIRLWRSASGKLEKTFEGRKCPVLCVSLSDDGKHIASVGSSGTLRIQDSATGIVFRERQLEEGESLDCASGSLDGKWIALAVSKEHETQIIIALAPEGREMTRFSTDGERVRALSFSGDGNVLLGSLRNNTILRWDLTDRRAGEQ
jgi:WD40 repeat protein